MRPHQEQLRWLAGELRRSRAARQRPQRTGKTSGALTTRLISSATLAVPPWKKNQLQPCLSHLKRAATIISATRMASRTIGLARALQASPGTLKHAPNIRASKDRPPMKIRFADSRPSGEYALVLPIAG